MNHLKQIILHQMKQGVCIKWSKEFCINWSKEFCIEWSKKFCIKWSKEFCINWSKVFYINWNKKSMNQRNLRSELKILLIDASEPSALLQLSTNFSSFVLFLIFSIYSTNVERESEMERQKTTREWKKEEKYQ